MLQNSYQPLVPMHINISFIHWKTAWKFKKNLLFLFLRRKYQHCFLSTLSFLMWTKPSQLCPISENPSLHRPWRGKELREKGWDRQVKLCHSYSPSCLFEYTHFKLFIYERGCACISKNRYVLFMCCLCSFTLLTFLLTNQIPGSGGQGGPPCCLVCPRRSALTRATGQWNTVCVCWGGRVSTEFPTQQWEWERKVKERTRWWSGSLFLILVTPFQKASFVWHTKLNVVNYPFNNWNPTD